MRMLSTVLAICASAAACAAAVSPTLPIAEWPDCEAATNAALPVATWQKRGHFDVRASRADLLADSAGAARRQAGATGAAAGCGGQAAAAFAARASGPCRRFRRFRGVFWEDERGAESSAAPDAAVACADAANGPVHLRLPAHRHRDARGVGLRARRRRDERDLLLRPARRCDRMRGLASI